jgi:hypothetical protein
LKRYNGPVTFDSRVMAEGWLARERELIQLAAYNGSVWISPAGRRAKAAVVGETVQSYATRWIEGRPNIKASTKFLYGDLLKNHIAPGVGECGIGSLTADIVGDWYSKLADDKPRVKSQAYSLLHAICGSAVEAELLSKNPCSIRGAMSSNRKRTPVLLSVDELT